MDFLRELVYYFSMKRDLRKKYLNIRKSILDKSYKDDLIFNKVISDERVLVSEDALIYVSFGDEVDTKRLIRYFLDVGKKVYVPRVSGCEMNFYRIGSFNDLEKGYKNILEPVGDEMISNFSKAICITPGACFNRCGYRIGYGGGFYDRFLSRTLVFSIGVCYKECFIDEDFNEEYDVAVNRVITD